MGTSSKGNDAQSPEESTELNINQPEASVDKPKKAPTPRNCRNFVRKETANALPHIVTAFVGEAKRGSVPHFTSLSRFGGFDQKPVPYQAPKRRRKTLARQLMDEVEKYEAKQAAELAAANAASVQTNDGSPQERT